MSIQIENLNKHFGTFHALKNIKLTVPSGSLTALLGPSGCGKTTLLRIIAGLEQADEGRIWFDGEDVSQRHVRERKVGFMLQHYALFRHMNVFDNVAFGLQVLPRAQRPSKAAIAARVHELLKLVQLDWLARAFPVQLSGGQRQRIALARALATEPKLLLLDEPFGALDAKVRKELRQWLRQIHHELGITSVLVTHDQEEALELADEIVVIAMAWWSRWAVLPHSISSRKVCLLPNFWARPMLLSTPVSKPGGCMWAATAKRLPLKPRGKTWPCMCARTNWH